MYFIKVFKLNFLSVSILTQRIQKKLFFDGVVIFRGAYD